VKIILRKIKIKIRIKMKKKKIEEKESYDISEFLVSIGTIIDEYDKIITNENTNNYFNNNN
jgi:hypothetical protein